MQRNNPCPNNSVHDLLTQYCQAFADENYPRLLELAEVSNNAFELNIELTIKPKDTNEKRMMTLAACLIRNANEDSIATLHKLRLLPGFKLISEKKTANGVLLFDTIHAAALYGNLEFLTLCLNELKLKTKDQAKAYLNEPATYDEVLAGNVLVHAFLAEKNHTYSKEVCEMLVKAGANPYNKFAYDHHKLVSLFALLTPSEQSFHDYIDILKRDKKKLVEFLNQKVIYQAENKPFQINIMEESILHLSIAWSDESTTTCKELLIPIMIRELNKEDLLKKAPPSILNALEKVRHIKSLYQAFCYDLCGMKITEKNWQKLFLSKLIESNKENEDYYELLGLNGNQICFMHSASENTAYLSVPDRNEKKVPIPVIESLAGTSASFILANDDRYTVNKDKSPSKRSDCRGRRENQPFFGPTKGHTPITFAVFAKNVTYIKDAISVDHADLNEPVVFGPYAGLTPIMIAIFMKHDAIVALLLKHFFVTNKLPVSSFSKKPLAGAFTGLTLQAAMKYASHENAAFFNDLMHDEAQQTKNVAASSNSEPRATRQNVKHKPQIEELHSAVVADISPSSDTTSSTSQRTYKQKANHSVEVYRSLLKQMQQDARDKVNSLNGLILAEKNQLDDIHNELSQMTIIPELKDDEDVDDKLTACQIATDALTKLMMRFNSLYKKCERALQEKPKYVAISDDNDDDDNTDENDADEAAVADTNTTASATPATEKEKPIYDTYGTNYTVLTPKSKTENTSKTKQKQPTQHHLFSAKQTNRAVVSALQINKRAKNLLSDSHDRISKLRKSYQHYQQYCASKHANGLFDADSAMAVSAMTAEALAVYETLLTLQRDHADFGIFRDATSAAAWRDMSKYAYAYIFSHDASYFNTLMTTTLDLISNAISNRLGNKAISVININQRPNDLVKAAKAGGNVIDENELIARYKNVLAIIENLNARAQKSDGASEMHQDSVRAKLFCLSLLGQVIKDGGGLKGINYYHRYSEALRTRILCHASGQNFTSDSETETAIPLLNFFSDALKFENGKEEVKAIINTLSISDLAKLLREILNVTSHKFDSEWVMLENRHIRELADHVAKRCQQVFSPTCSERATAILNSLEKWQNDPAINQNALSHQFFTKLKEALNDIACDNTSDALIHSKILLSSPGMPNRFNSFAKQFGITNPAKKTLESAEQLYMEVVTHSVNQATLASSSARSMRLS